MTKQREIVHTIKAHATSDGDGVKISRVAGFDNHQFSPFLMLDQLKSEQRSDYVGGFPPHPHRGIETLTYMLKGHFQHKDHMGNVGELRSGGAQWMAAGRGVIHSEMPIMEQGDLHGFQIWINQPARDKMKPAQYFDFQTEMITELYSQQHGLHRVIAGGLTADGKQLHGPLDKTGVDLSVSDWRANTGQKTLVNTPPTHNMMLFVYQGRVSINGDVLSQGHMALLSQGETLALNSVSESGVLLLSGQPIAEPIVHYGPFVMNSMAEIEQAIQDYNSGIFETY